jgi:preprotein translocase subunit SecA
MLQHASNGSEQLVKIGLDEWISIAQKQKWSEIGYLLKQYGSIGYYLGVLDNKGFKKELEQMRKIIDEATIIPEKLIALYTQWIVTGEVDADEKFFNQLKNFFIRANGYPELKDKITKHQLITTEIEQAKLINWLTTGKISENYVNYGELTSKYDRNVDELTKKITGLHDSAEAAEQRRKSIQKIGKLLQLNNSQTSQSIYWVNKFDEALFKLKKKRLRDTQKMAILCAVESETHVLEQVNTGEGKSFIIAAIATIRRKTGKRYVDIITSSPVLAQRDAAEMAELYQELGLTVADNCSEDLEARKKAYAADIIYGDIARFQRDHLLHTFYKKPLKGDRTQVAVIVDEVDNMLLDNGNNMLYLSHSVPGMDLLDSLLIFIQQQIHSPIYTGDKNNLEQMQDQFDNTTIKKKVLADIFGQFLKDDLKSIVNSSIPEVKVVAMYEKLIQGKIIDADGYLKIHRHDQLQLIDGMLKQTDAVFVNRIKACFSVIISRERSIEVPVYLRNFVKLHLDELIENCKHALFLEVNTGYVVDVDHTGRMTSALEPLITIIDSNTGADLATSQWCGGLHQFLQLKHGCRLSPMSLKAVFISNVAYLKGYKHINGLSGTLGSTEESKTLIELYKADLIKIPTNKAKVFYEHVPAIATVEEEWISNIYDEICDQVSGTRSVLLICEDIKQLDYVYDRLIKCFKTNQSTSKKIKECFTTITLYKREHDEFNFEEEHKLQPHRLIIATNLAGRGTDIKLSQSLIDAGGLHVITAFMPKNCRIEEQAYGRAARFAVIFYCIIILLIFF